MRSNNTFHVLFLLARPAAGKSEIIKFINNLPISERLEKFHIGEIREIDDFPMLWDWFEEDAILNKLGKPSLHSDTDGYFLHRYFWDVLIEKICNEFDKAERDQDSDHPVTYLIEFSRGTEHGGYQSAFKHLTRAILTNAAILYVNVPWEESLRKNRKRFNPDRPDSILEHSLPDRKLEKLYRYSDWEVVSQNDNEYIEINGKKIPYVVFENSDDVTSEQGEKLRERLTENLQVLWNIYNKNGLIN